MTVLSRLRSFTRHIFRRHAIDNDLDDEIQSTLALLTDQKIKEGMLPDDARRAARIELGGVEQVKKQVRAVRTGAWLDSLLQDIRLALRMLSKNPGFAIIAILTLALGIGANTAIFSVIDALLLRELPVQQPERLVQISQTQANGATSPLTFPMFQYIERRQQVFAGVFGWYGDGIFPVTAGTSVSFDDVWAVTGNFYSELGVSPQLGRLIALGDADPANGSPPQIAVLGYGFWQRQFSGDPSAIGREILVNDQPFTIVGVTRQDFSGMSAVAAPDVTVPITAVPLLTGGRLDLTETKSIWLQVGARLKTGVTIPRARAQVQTFWPQLRAATLPQGYSSQLREDFLSTGVAVTSAKTGTALSLRASFSQQLFMLMGMVGLLLLAACLNLANLMLARAASRNHELSVRAAIGASRWRLIRQLATESLLLSGLGALLGLAMALWCSRLLVNFMTQYYLVPAALNLKPDLRVFAVTAAAAILAGIICAIAPAWFAARQDPARALQHNARSFSRSAGKSGKLLVVIQVALSVVLLVGAGLLARSLESLRSANPGFAIDGLLTVTLYARSYQGFDAASYYRELVQRVSSVEGVRAASWTLVRPGQAHAHKAYVSPAGGEASRKAVSSVEGFISPGFFDAVGVPVLDGRGFLWTDNDRGAPGAILNSKLARQMFPSGGALGQFIRVGDDPNYAAVQVVGIVNDGRLLDVRDPQGPAIYLSMLQNPLLEKGGGDLIVRVSANSQGTIAAVRQEIESLGREYVLNVRTVGNVSDQTLLPERTMAILSGCFAAVALLLCVIGLYGLMSYSVAGRTREIGIRVALGAQRAEVLVSVLRESLSSTVIGIAIGLPCALAATRLIQNMIYGISRTDFTTFALVIGALLAVALIAGYIPARRATRIDPVSAMRCE